MPAFEAVFFDADDTLFDFKEAERNALRQLLHEEYHLAPEEEAAAVYHHINEGLWRQYERQEITREELVNTRFARFFQQMGMEEDGIVANRRYLDRLACQSCLTPGALEVCRRLASRYRLFILTNGISRVQRSRLAGSPIRNFISGIFISEEIGFQKPLKGYFDHVLGALSPLPPQKALMVGDSLISDIRGAQGAGIPACWFHAPGADLPPGYSPDYEITRLEELEAILQ